MRILIIGGTRFNGPFLVRQLVAGGHEVTVFHRGEHQAELPAGVRVLRGDRNQAADAATLLLRDAAPDVVIDMIAFTRQNAEWLVDTFRGVARRVVVPSSEDVYRAYGRLHRTEPGPPDPTPLTEDSPLRQQPSIHGPIREKLDVEQVVMSQPDLPGTILRLPAIYGPGDWRMHEHLRPMLDQRPMILLDEKYAAWKWTHGYVENVAHAIALAATNDRAAGRIYNVGEADAPPQYGRINALAVAAAWTGSVVTLPPEALPKRFEALDWSQDWTVDTTRIRTELGYSEIVRYDVGLQRTIEWHRAHPNDKLAPTAEQFAEDEAAVQLQRRNGRAT